LSDQRGHKKLNYGAMVLTPSRAYVHRTDWPLRACRLADTRNWGWSLKRVLSRRNASRYHSSGT
jgi:hypothetical protein